MRPYGEYAVGGLTGAPRMRDWRRMRRCERRDVDAAHKSVQRSKAREQGKREARGQ